MYSLEFYELVAAHLAPGGLFAQWVPTPRVLTTVKQVFPHVLVMEVPGGRGVFLLASATALPFDRDTLTQRLIASAESFSETQRRSVLEFAATTQPKVERAGEAAPAVAPSEVNTDLFPRDEYFLNSN